MVIGLQDIPTISKGELKILLIIGTHLHQWQGNDKNDLGSIIQQQGFIQLDPLNPAGRNHDIFLLARSQKYRIGEFEGNLYPKQDVFEDYMHSLNAIKREFFPIFYSCKSPKNLSGRYWEEIKKFLIKKPDSIVKIKNFVQDNGPISIEGLKSFESSLLGKKKWTANSGGNILEYLSGIGEVIVAKRDENFRKLFDLTEKYFSSSELSTTKIKETQLWQEKLKLFLHAFPVVDSKITISNQEKLKFSRSKLAWLKRTGNSLDLYINTTTERNKRRNTPTVVYCKELKKIYFVPESWKDLIKQEIDDEMRIIAPLDPLIYDRDLAKNLFQFEYTWDIYKPVSQRKWGYYVYPLYFKGKLIGRLEAKKPKNSNILEIFNFHREKSIKYTLEIQSKFQECI